MRKIRMLSGLLLAIAGAGPALGGEVAGLVAEPPLTRWYKPAYVAAGEGLYAENCSTCHGSNGEGAPNWQRPDAGGHYPPPPLNGTGHAWHHPLKGLYQTIMQGSPDGSGRMPAWQGKLSKGEALAIIAWFQSHWSDEIYAAWHRMNEKAKAEAKKP